MAQLPKKGHIAYASMEEKTNIQLLMFPLGFTWSFGRQVIGNTDPRFYQTKGFILFDCNDRRLYECGIQEPEQFITAHPPYKTPVLIEDLTQAPI